MTQQTRREHLDGLAMALLVVGTHRKTPLVQMRRHLTVTPGVFAQTVHHQHRAQRLGGRAGRELWRDGRS